MKGNRIAASVFVLGILSAFASQAHAADGSVCYSTPVFSMTQSGVYGTTSYPQLSNTTKFSCSTTIPLSTIKELSQAGWIIVSTSPVVYSTTTSQDGSVTTKTRVLLVIKK